MPSHSMERPNEPQATAITDITRQQHSFPIENFDPLKEITRPKLNRKDTTDSRNWSEGSQYGGSNPSRSGSIDSVLETNVRVIEGSSTGHTVREQQRIVVDQSKALPRIPEAAAKENILTLHDQQENILRRLREGGTPLRSDTQELQDAFHLMGSTITDQRETSTQRFLPGERVITDSLQQESRTRINSPEPMSDLDMTYHSTAAYQQRRREIRQSSLPNYDGINRSAARRETLDEVTQRMGDVQYLHNFIGTTMEQMAELNNNMGIYKTKYIEYTMKLEDTTIGEPQRQEFQNKVNLYRESMQSTQKEFLKLRDEWNRNPITVSNQLAVGDMIAKDFMSHITTSYKATMDEIQSLKGIVQILAQK